MEVDNFIKRMAKVYVLYIKDLDEWVVFTDFVQGDPKKMSHKDSWLNSVLEVRFYFSAGVLEPENRPRFI